MNWVPLRELLPDMPLPPYFRPSRLLEADGDALKTLGFQIAVADIGAVSTESELLCTLGEALDFGSGYRANWDALYDCLGDLLRSGAPSTALLLRNSSQMLHDMPHEFVRAVHFLSDAVDEVSRDGGTFQFEVLYFGDW